MLARRQLASLRQHPVPGSASVSTPCVYFASHELEYVTLAYPDGGYRWLEEDTPFDNAPVCLMPAKVRGSASFALTPCAPPC
jgi:hypothetical protein